MGELLANGEDLEELEELQFFQDGNAPSLCRQQSLTQMIDITVREFEKCKAATTFTPHTPKRIKTINADPMLTTRKKAPRIEFTDAIFQVTWLVDGGIEGEGMPHLDVFQDNQGQCSLCKGRAIIESLCL
jgi:hypothetical protein